MRWGIVARLEQQQRPSYLVRGTAAQTPTRVGQNASVNKKLMTLQHCRRVEVFGITHMGRH